MCRERRKATKTWNETEEVTKSVRRGRKARTKGREYSPGLQGLNRAERTGTQSARTRRLQRLRTPKMARKRSCRHVNAQSRDTGPGCPLGEQIEPGVKAHDSRRNMLRVKTAG